MCVWGWWGVRGGKLVVGACVKDAGGIIPGMNPRPAGPAEPYPILLAFLGLRLQDALREALDHSSLLFVVLDGLHTQVGILQRLWKGRGHNASGRLAA